MKENILHAIRLTIVCLLFFSGIYTLIGSRTGYRTVRVDVEVTVGQQQLMTEVRCIDRI